MPDPLVLYEATPNAGIATPDGPFRAKQSRLFRAGPVEISSSPAAPAMTGDFSKGE